MDLEQRVARLDWPAIEAGLDGFGGATAGVLLGPEECALLAAGYEDAALFRSRVVMARHGFGSGEYQYYAYPLPPPIAALR
ncbi:MAG: proline hydroxylase, partial [Acetobacteraceae bacterium]|nr:proline hydroxylase [Acetobacteraceae bacterium]